MFRHDLREVTPTHLQCGLGACPAVFETDNDTYVVVGQAVPHDKLPPGRVASGETVVEIPRAILDHLLKGRQP